ncbi:MAG: VWA domain-containing protein [Planctomycetota bacterium]|nr:MAG: VWA domain-containing protein [Planctomycetota bacterium]
MSWAYPSLLWLLLAVAALPLWWILQRRLLLMRSRRLGSMEAHRYRGYSRWRQVLPTVALLGAWVALVLALAGPRHGGDSDDQTAEGYSIVVVVDCSYSMYSQDLYPSRMRHAHFKVHDLLRLQPNAEVGLLPFAGIAALRSPLTTDHTGVRLLLEDCTPELFRREDQGTAIGNAVQRAVVALQGDEERGRVILVLSDGDDPDHAAVQEAAARARDEGITVYGLVIGDPDQHVTLTINGREEPMPPARATLDTLSEATGGLTLITTSDDSDLRTMVAHMQEHVQAHSWRIEQQVVASERYQWPLAAALLLFAIALLVPSARRAMATLVIMVMVVSTGAADEFAGQVAQAVEHSEEDPDRARAQLDAVLLHSPDHPAAHYNRGLLSEDRQRRVYHLRRAAAGSHARIAAAAHHYLARMALDEGRYSAAHRHLQQAVEGQPDNETYRQALAALAQQLNDSQLVSDPPALPRQLPPARIGSSYSQQLLQAFPAATRIRLWGDGSLPEGLAMTAEGHLSGEPEFSGMYRFRVVVSDQDGEIVGRPWLGIQVLPRLEMRDAALAPAVVGEMYHHRLTLRGGVRPQWSAGDLPQGIQGHAENDGSFLLSGIPRQPGAYSLRITVRDADGAQVQETLHLQVERDPVPDRVLLPAATRSARYQHQLQVRGSGTTPQWQEVQEGGLSLQQDGVVQGIPEGEPMITLVSTFADREWQLRVPVNARPALILPERLTGIVGRPERWEMPVRDGTPPYRLSLEQGDLPEGMQLREDGVLLGAPQEEGDYPLTILVVDRWQALARSHVLLHVRQRSAAHEEEPPPQDGDEDRDEGGDDASDAMADDAGDGEPDQDQTAQDMDGQQEDSDDRSDNFADDGGSSPDEQSPDQDEPGTDDPHADQEPDLGEHMEDEEEGGVSGDDTATPDRSQQEARRWLDDILGDHQEDLDESLRDFMRHSGEGSGDSSQPW